MSKLKKTELKSLLDICFGSQSRTVNAFGQLITGRTEHPLWGWAYQTRILQFSENKTAALKYLHFPVVLFKKLLLILHITLSWSWHLCGSRLKDRKETSSSSVWLVGFFQWRGLFLDDVLEHVPVNCGCSRQYSSARCRGVQQVPGSEASGVKAGGVLCVCLCESDHLKLLLSTEDLK